MEIRKILTYSDETWFEGGRSDSGDPLRKVAVVAVIENPYANADWSENLDELIEPSAEIARILANEGQRILNGQIESFGKAAVVGLQGEQEHANACITGVFGDSLRDAINGGDAWLPSVTKRAAPGELLDIPVCYRHEIWVRSHYDAISVTLHDAPMPDEIAVALALTNRGRINARLGGKGKDMADLERNNR